MFKFSATPPLSLYVHIPWCVRKCPYCDFNSHPVREAVPEGDYVAAVLADLEQDLPRVRGRTVGSLFFGGGTPSLLSAQAIDRLLTGIRARLAVKPEAEITLEANPGTVDAQKFAEFRAAGINRLSIGIQSFQADLLRRIGRIHGGHEAIRAVEAAHRAGFDNVNLDLMFGLPGQDVSGALEDVRTAVDLGPTHLSFYQLTLEPNTLFHHQPPPLPDDEIIWKMQQRGQALLAKSGYRQYEVSAFSQPGRRCVHNLNYWQFGDYLGIGAGAHAKLTDGQRQRIIRIWKVKAPRDYLTKAAGSDVVGGITEPTADAVILEFMMNVLRLNEGFPSSLFKERTGLSLARIQPRLAQAVQRGFLVVDEGSMRPTATGRCFLNEVLALFMPEHEAPYTARPKLDD